MMRYSRVEPCSSGIHVDAGQHIMLAQVVSIATIAQEMRARTRNAIPSVSPAERQAHFALSLHPAVGALTAPCRPDTHCGVAAEDGQRYRSLATFRSLGDPGPDAGRCNAVATRSVARELAAGRTAFLSVSLVSTACQSGLPTPPSSIAPVSQPSPTGLFPFLAALPVDCPRRSASGAVRHCPFPNLIHQDKKMLLPIEERFT